MLFEFMTGATAFALINLFFFIVIAYLSYRLASRAMSYIQNGCQDKISKIVGFDGVALVSIFVLMIFFGSVSQPKLSLDPAQNRELIEYQEQNPEIVIETPAPRTEKLEGFTPLKKD